MFPIAPTTELEAVNTILSVLGESPVSSLEDSGNADADSAEVVLRGVSRTVQSKGWAFNTDRKVVLALSFPDNFIYVPSNALRVDTSGDSAGIDAVQRGTRMWNKDTNTYVFTKSLTVDMIVGLDFSELPQAARDYITFRAGRVYQSRWLGSSQLDQFSQRDENNAWVTLLQEQGEVLDANLLKSDPVNAIMHRRM